TYAQFAEFDASRAAVSADVTRRMTQTLSFEVFGSWQRIHYDNDRYYETDWPVGAALVMTPGKHTSFRLRADHLSHNVTGPGVSVAENRVFLIAEYRPWTGAEAVSAP
ncbi:MAG TPA: hypothetical protein VLX90_13350, partial [Steroidobacteraceae bacterium]|nr:hypothetical protein [Steroidobacteraceae bacterium]